MKNKIHGPSLYYASDKNIFDALNQHKVDSKTVLNLFKRRNIIVSKKSPRDDLAEYFSRLTHDYFDHQDISTRLGVVPRRERITSMDLQGADDMDEVNIAIDQLKSDLESHGDVVQVSRENENVSINVQYTTIDYKKSEFSQVQTRDGVIEFIRENDGYIVRNHQNPYLNDVRDTLINKIEKVADKPLEKVVISLFDIPTPRLRSKFFYDLINDLEGYQRTDVTDVYVYKQKPEQDDPSAPPETHIERVFLRGNGVTRTVLLNDLLDEEDYYITKIGWEAKETMGLGNEYAIEALFENPRDCTNFSFILSGVYPVEDGAVSKTRRAPTKEQINIISRVVESKARELVATLRDEFQSQ